MRAWRKNKGENERKEKSGAAKMLRQPKSTMPIYKKTLLTPDIQGHQKVGPEWMNARGREV